MSGVTGSLAYMGAEEFLDSFLTMWAMDEGREALAAYSPVDKDTNPYIKEGIESAQSLMMMAGIFKIIRYSESLLERMFTVASAILTALLGLGKKGFQKLKAHAMKGRRFKALANFLSGVLEDVIEKCKIFVAWLGNLINAGSNSFQAGSLMSASASNRNNVVERDRSSMMMGQNVANNMIQSLLFKVLTKSFKESDEVVLKKILGRENVSNTDVDDVNKIADFFYVKDSSGKVVGYTEVAYELLNGLGYIHNTGNNPIP